MALSRGSADWNRKHYGPGWPQGTTNLKTIEIFGHNLAVHEDTVRAFMRLDHIFKENAPDYYKTIKAAVDVGTYNNRPIGGTSTPSNHSFGTAIDLKWQENGYGKDPFDCPIWTQARAAVLKAENEMDDIPLFRWGGRYRTPDAMHFEVMMTLAEQKARITKEGLKK